MSAAMPAVHPPRLYGIADADALAPRRVDQAVREMADAGVRWVQVRAKHASGAELCAMLERVLEAARATETRVWIDDRVDLAAMWPMAGVHLGQNDLPPVAARGVLDRPCWIGWSTHNDEQVAQAEADGAVDVVAIGPVFATGSKSPPDPTVGLDGVRRARALTTKPLVAIGGIDDANAGAVLDAGADTVAVIGALCRGSSVARSARRLLQAVGESAPGIRRSRRRTR